MRIFHFVFLLVIFVSFVAASDDDDDDENESKGSPKSSGHTTKSYTQTKDPHGSQNPKNRSSITEEPGDSPAPKTLASGAPKSRPPTKEARKTTVADDPEDSPSPTNETRKTTVANDPEDSPAPKTLASAATKSRPPTKEVKKTTVADEPEDSPSPENKTHVTSGSTHKPAVKKSTPIGSKPSTHGNTFKTSKRPPTNSPKPILPKKGDYVLTGVVLCEREKNAWLQVDTEVSVLPNIKGNGHVYVKNTTNAYGRFSISLNRDQLLNSNPSIRLEIKSKDCPKSKLEPRAVVDLSGKQIYYKFGPLLLQ